MGEAMDRFSLKGKVAIITGGYAWLGYDMAEALADAGCHIIITSRELAKAQEAADKLEKAYGVECLGLQMDQQYYEQVDDMAKKAKGWKGHIDILINNAGGGAGASEGNLFMREPEAIQSMISINLTGTLFCCRAVGSIMKEQQSGKIINIGSIAGIVGRDRGMYYRTDKMEQPVDYAAAKGGVISMTRDLAAVLAPDHVNVNCISPGGFNRGLPENFANAYSERTALGRMGKMGDLQGAALFLSSSASDYMTGHNLVVDGGFSMWQ
ncbi:MAG: SDR family oxidoreductase [Eubacteriales bacterium]